jgi:drug/metabolite transporter (DMT)-like permease
MSADDVRRAADPPFDVSSNTIEAAKAPNWRAGLAMGGLGMLAFSGTLPATRLAVPEFGPFLLTAGRIEIAALLGALALLLTGRRRLPERRHWGAILTMGLGLAIGYPLCVSLALQSVPASHGAVIVGLAPAATALIAVWRTGERPPLSFWIGSSIGLGAVIAFAVEQGGGRLRLADGWLLLALLSVGLAYVEGGRVARALGGVTALSWAMIALAPLVALPLAAALLAHDWSRPISGAAWACFWYAAVVSMFLGSVAWYRGLAAGGIARIGQLNLIQPLASLLWAALFLEEEVSGFAMACAVVIALAMTMCLRSRVATRPTHVG